MRYTLALRKASTVSETGYKAWTTRGYRSPRFRSYLRRNLRQPLPTNAPSSVPGRNHNLKRKRKTISVDCYFDLSMLEGQERLSYLGTVGKASPRIDQPVVAQSILTVSNCFVHFMSVCQMFDHDQSAGITYLVNRNTIDSVLQRVLREFAPGEFTQLVSFRWRYSRHSKRPSAVRLLVSVTVHCELPYSWHDARYAQAGLKCPQSSELEPERSAQMRGLCPLIWIPR